MCAAPLAPLYPLCENVLLVMTILAAAGSGSLFSPSTNTPNEPASWIETPSSVSVPMLASSVT